MVANHSSVQYLQGLRHIERNFLAKAKEAHLAIDDGDLHYRNLSLIGHPPSVLWLDVTWRGKTLSIPLPREQVSDCCSGIEHRPDAVSLIRSLVAQLTEQAAA